MARLDLILIYVLHFEALIGGKLIYKRAGEDAALPCAASSCDPTRRLVSWLYSRDGNHILSEVDSGNVTAGSLRAAQLSLDPRCSLVIRSVTAADAGRYTCGRGQRAGEDVYLIVLTISPSPPDAEPKRDGEVALACSLWRHSDLRPCRRDSFRWANETGAELLDEGVGHRVLRQTNCVSVLTVKRQSGLSRRYTCRFVDMNGVAIEAEYTPDFTVGPTSDPDSTGWTPLSYAMLALRVGGLILIIVITVVVIRNRWNTKPLDDDDEVDHEVQYENVEAASAAARV